MVCGLQQEKLILSEKGFIFREPLQVSSVFPLGRHFQRAIPIAAPSYQRPHFAILQLCVK